MLRASGVCGGMSVGALRARVCLCVYVCVSDNRVVSAALLHSQIGRVPEALQLLPVMLLRPLLMQPLRETLSDPVLPRQLAIPDDPHQAL